MKNSKHNLFPLLLFSLLFFSGLNRISAQTKHALLIGVGDYPEKSGWQSLNAANDIQLLKQALLLQGFTQENILILKDESATKAMISRYLTEDFPKQLNLGDIAVVHFSGHGQQIADNNGDEVDGYDEAIVPFDSPLKYEKGVYEGENLIRDEALGQFLRGIRKKLGVKGHLLVTLDACHSGTGTRGLGITRGTNQKMATPDYVIQNAARLNEDNSLEQEMNGSKTNLAPMVTFFSTSAGELSYEFQDNQNQSYGLLSYTLSKLLSSTHPTNYQALLEKLKLEMNKLGALQTPQAEGILQQEIFGGQFSKPVTFFTIKELIDGQTILLDAGELHGITKDAIIEFYPKDTRNIAATAPLVTGVVNFTTLLDSDVILMEKNISKAVLLETWAVLKKAGFAPFKLKLQVQLRESAARLALLEKIQTISAIQLVDTFPDLQLITNQDQLQLINNQDQLIFQKEITVTRVEELIEQILNYAQVAYLRTLEVEDKYISLAIALINKETGELMDAFKVGETMIIQLSNTGKKPIYYQIIDIQPDNKLAIAIPSAPYVAADFLIQPGETQIVPIELDIYPPIGNELFKIIATNQPMDLKSSILTQHQMKANINQPFDDLLKIAKGKVNLKGEKARISIFSKSFSIN